MKTNGGSDFSKNGKPPQKGQPPATKKSPLPQANPYRPPTRILTPSDDATAVAAPNTSQLLLLTICVETTAKIGFYSGAN